jgi:glycosyltransferase involved in cell wall biosynthesis
MDRAAAPVVVIIPAKDEELHIERAIRSAAPIGPVVVVDAESTDRTAELAKAAGAIVVNRPWLGYAAQKNWAMDHLPLEAEWVLFLDADEYFSDALTTEIAACVDRPESGFFLARENIVLGKALKHAWWYPDYQMRLFRAGRGRFEERLVHEHVLVDGEVGYLSHPLIHENVKGIGAWLERHIRYAELEARQIRSASSAGDSLRSSFRGTRAERRRALKTRVWYRMPMRPAIRFVWMYVVKRGFLDGRQGLAYSQLVAAYDAMIDAYLLELKNAENEDKRRVALGDDSVRTG